MRERIFALLSRHQRLDLEITMEQRRLVPDSGRLQRLKRLKLAIKDRIARAMRRYPRIVAG